MSNDFQTTAGQSALLEHAGNLDRFYESTVFAVEYAAQAINEVVEKYGSQKLTPTLKKDGSPVSEADRAAHDVLKTRLAAFSSFPLISEEEASGVPPLESVIDQPFFWLADPLDGTRDFLAGETTFAVSLALMRVEKGIVTPYFGCIADPTLQTTWWGSRDTPLTKRRNGEADALPDAVEGVAGIDREIRVLGSRSIPSERMKALYEFWRVNKIERMGSALKFARIAEGSFDVYPRFGPTSEWDTAAGQVLLEITGGGLFSIETGQPMHYGKPHWRNHGFLAASSQKLIQEWLPQIKKRLSD